MTMKSPEVAASTAGRMSANWAPGDAPTFHTACARAAPTHAANPNEPRSSARSTDGVALMNDSGRKPRRTIRGVSVPRYRARRRARPFLRAWVATVDLYNARVTGGLMSKSFVLLLLFCETVSAQSQPSVRVLAIRDVTVIDCTGAAPQPEMTVVVRENRIAEIGKSSKVAIPEGARVVDGKGKFLIPGLWDMHGHFAHAGSGAVSLLIANGVTGVRDPGGDLGLVQRLRSEIASGERIGPHIVAAGPFVDGQDRAKWHVLVRNDAEARELVRSIKQRGADFVKIHNALSREAFFAAMDEARKQGMRVAVHLPEEVTIAEASDAGAASLEHVEMLVQSEMRNQNDPAKTFDEACGWLNGEQGAALWAKLLENDAWYVPTMVAYERGFVLWSNKPEAMAKRRPIHMKQIDLVGVMHKAGVKIMAGSDFSDW